MTDRRRSQWIAWDAHFLNDALGMELYDRFGSAGVALFVAFLSACKRNHVQGQITFASDPDLLAALGLPGMVLVNEAGDGWDADSFWRWLGERHVTRRSKRGRLHLVQSTQWDKWQEDFGRQRDADRKRRERANDPSTTDGRTDDDAPTTFRRPSDDLPTTQKRTGDDEENRRSAATNATDEPETDIDNDIDRKTKTRTGVDSRDIETVFESWQNATGKDRARLDDKRRKLIAARLREYPVDDLLAAVWGWKKSAYHRGENDRGVTYNDLGLLLRDAAHVEQFRDLHLGTSAPSNGHNPHTTTTYSSLL